MRTHTHGPSPSQYFFVFNTSSPADLYSVDYDKNAFHNPMYSKRLWGAEDVGFIWLNLYGGINFLNERFYDMPQVGGWGRVRLNTNMKSSF